MKEITSKTSILARETISTWTLFFLLAFGCTACKNTTEHAGDDHHQGGIEEENAAGKDESIFINSDLLATSADQSLPTYRLTFSQEETTEVRQAFSWAETEPLLEVNENGRPALYYVLLLVPNSHVRDFMDQTGIYYSPLPLFPEEIDAMEQEDEESQKGKLLYFEGDESGSFAFSILPGELYNIFREAGFEDKSPLPVILLREAPIEEAVLSDGSLSYEYLASQGFNYRLASSDSNLNNEVPNQGVPPNAQAQPFLGKVIGFIRKVATAAVNKIRSGFAQVREVIGGSRKFEMCILPLNTDATFGINNPIRRAWGRNQGEVIYPKGAKVHVMQNMNLKVGHLDEKGCVSMDIPKGRRMRVFLILENSASQFITMSQLWRNRIKVFQAKGMDRDAPVILGDMSWSQPGEDFPRLIVRDSQMNSFVQMTDSHQFSETILNFRPKQATVVMGPVARARDANAYAFCLSYLGIRSLGNGGLIPSIGGFLADYDIAMRGPGGASRSTPTHEYGHFLMCSMVNRISSAALAYMITQAMREYILDGHLPTSILELGIIELLEYDDTLPAKAVLEGFADFFSSQVAGGVRYFNLRGAWQGLEPWYGNYCEVDRDTQEKPCLDDNFGAPQRPGDFPYGQVIESQHVGNESVDFHIARFASILHDVFDGHSNTASNVPSNARLWTKENPDPNAPLLLIPGWGSDSRDEEIALDGSQLMNIFRRAISQTTRLSPSNMYQAMARVMLDQGYTGNQICELFALHALSLSCEDMISVNEIQESFVPSPPISLRVEIIKGDSARDPVAVRAQWEDVSPLADEFRVELVRQGSVIQGANLPYSRYTNEWTSGLLDFDEAVTVRIKTVFDGIESEPVEATVHTYAEPLQIIQGESLRSAARIFWEPVQASSYIVEEITLTGGLKNHQTENNQIIIRGLQAELLEDESYRFRVYAANAEGVRVEIPSNEIAIRPLAPNVIWVSHSVGDDDNPRAGSAEFPFATLQAALAVVEERETDTIRMETGEYEFIDTLIFDGLALTLEGGYELDGLEWRRTENNSVFRTRIRLPNEQRVTGVEIRNDSNIIFDKIEIINGCEDGCSPNLGEVLMVNWERAAVLIIDSNVSLKDSVVRNELQESYYKTYGIFTSAENSERDVIVFVENSFVIGNLFSGNPENFQTWDTYGIYTQGNHAQWTIHDSNIIGFQTEIEGLSNGGSLYGGWISGIRVNISRSRIQGLSGPPSEEWFSGGQTGLMIVGVDGASVWIDNSIIQVTQSTSVDDALMLWPPRERYLRDEIPVAFSSIEIRQSTFSVGSNWWDEDLIDFVRANRHSHTIRMTELTAHKIILENNLFSLAKNNSQIGNHLSMFNVRNIINTSLVRNNGELRVNGNAFSMHYQGENNDLVPIVRKHCGIRDNPFERIVVDSSTEEQINIVNENPIANPFSCLAEAPISSEGNFVFTNLPGNGPEEDRQAVVLDEEGRPVNVNNNREVINQETGTNRLLRMRGRSIRDLDLPYDISRDLGGRERNLDSPGIGAWIVD